MKKVARVMITVFFIAIAWILGEGANRAVAESVVGEQVVGGPYVVNAGQRSATVMWMVQTGQAAIGIAPDKLGTTVPMLRVEKLHMTGLKPGTQYYYQSFPGDAGKGSFKTAPAGVVPFQFVVYGDTVVLHAARCAQSRHRLGS